MLGGLDVRGRSELLGRPGIRITQPAPVRQLEGVRRDVAAFLGVAPRGSARTPAGAPRPDEAVASWLAAAPVRRSVPVAVTSWDEYRLRFGGYEGPGRLPYAVSAFFAGGGRLAWIVRIVHDYGDPGLDAAARAEMQLGALATTGGQTLTLWARSEGTWGNRLEATLRFRSRPLALRGATAAVLDVDPGEWVPGGSLLRLELPGGAGRFLRYADQSRLAPDPGGAGRRRLVALDLPLAAPPESAEVVTADLEVVDSADRVDRRERIEHVGLRADHPRWVGRALIEDSALLWPDEDWAAGTVALGDPELPDVVLEHVPDVDGAAKGRDRWADIVPEDFWDPTWTPGDEVAGDGVQSLAEHADLGLLATPDLYDPRPLPPLDDVTDPPTLCGPEFAVHVGLDDPPSEPTGPPAAPGLVGLARDPLVPSERDQIIAAQQALVAHAELRRDLTVLLDVPPRLSTRQILEWRTAFDSPFAAAYHPWLDVAAPDDQRDALVRATPSGFAAGIIAEREHRLGLPFGPANQIARGAVRVGDTVRPDDHDALHVAGVNVFVPARDGIRLTGARTLSRRPALRQLSVARIMTMLRLTLLREMQWAVFEPSSRALWAELRRLVEQLLTRLFEQGAFRGATTSEAFFVRCDRTTMTQHDLDNGRVICLVGVAPAEPIEYLVLEMALEADRAVSIRAAP